MAEKDTTSIAAIQAALTHQGFGSGIDVDGKLDAATVRQIKAFQVAHGLAADGKPGPLTRAALFPETVPARPDDGAPVQAPSPKPGPWPLQRDCMSFYGAVGMHQATLALPFAMRLAWDKNTLVRSIKVHEKVHDAAARAFARIADAYDEAARRKIGLDLFGGSLNVRKMRGGNAYSMHSWGIAIDFDPDRNQLKWGRDRARLAQPDAERFWKIWEEEGAVSLGRARNFDWMHVQFARL